MPRGRQQGTGPIQRYIIERLAAQEFSPTTPGGIPWAPTLALAVDYHGRPPTHSQEVSFRRAATDLHQRGLIRLQYQGAHRRQQVLGRHLTGPEHAAWIDHLRAEDAALAAALLQDT